MNVIVFVILSVVDSFFLLLCNSFGLNAMNAYHALCCIIANTSESLLCLFRLNVVRMEALSVGNELGLEVSAAINLGGEEHETITLRSSKGLLSATLVDLKEKCMEVLGAHLQRHSVPLDEPDLDALDETFEEDEDTKEEPVEGAAPPKKKSN